MGIRVGLGVRVGFCGGVRNELLVIDVELGEAVGDVLDGGRRGGDGGIWERMDDGMWVAVVFDGGGGGGRVGFGLS